MPHPRHYLSYLDDICYQASTQKISGESDFGSCQSNTSTTRTLREPNSRKMDVARSIETSVSYNSTMWSHNPEGHDLYAYLTNLLTNPVVQSPFWEADSLS
jgi:hypothetical protein